MITLWRLGLHNLIWVLGYRLALKFGFITRNMKIGSLNKGPFFNPTPVEKKPLLDSLDLRVFGWIEYSKQNPPVWYRSITSGKMATVQNLHWSKISDFDLAIGDIKTVWELSRFDWLFYFVIEYLKTGDETYLFTLNRWLDNWSANNPVNQGINWKCGQEASIRVMHLCLAAFLLQQHKALSSAVIEMLEQHLARISPTVLYAMAQDNNHGTSEAVALFIGGLILEHNTHCKQAVKWKKQGRFWIENRVKRLISEDGSFSQHSVNYHRLMLDSLCLAEFFRLRFAERQFSQTVLNKLKLATGWLRIFTDECHGDAPNLGANDGARLIPLSNTDYRDYRPSIQLASVLFFDKKAYQEEGAFNQSLKLLSVNANEVLASNNSSRHFSEGGYVYIKKGTARLYMRYPVFKFRPSQCDLLHVDFWLQGQNILRDAGSFSYNTEEQWLDYFPGTGAHNTIQFDNCEQMPRLSRFLYSDWLRAQDCSGLFETNDATGFKVGYKSAQGFEHHREVALSPNALAVTDIIDGFKERAILRWRLPPGNYDVRGNSITTLDFELIVEVDAGIKRFELVDGWESRYYLKKTSLPVLEIELAEPAKILTTIRWTNIQTQ